MNPWNRALRLTVASVVLIASGLGGLITAPAVPVAAEPTSPVATLDETNPGRLVLVMDSSGSMAEPSGGGQSRIEAAKSALDDVIAGLPADQEVGMRVYGATVFSRDDQGACSDSELVVPIKRDNRAALSAAVAEYEPYGETPISYALGQAGKDLGDRGERQIILVSDGEETCEPDPCPTAEKLAKQGIELTINVVGLNVEGKAREDLQCIARAGRGRYFDASDAGSLADSLEQAAMRKAEVFTPTGTMIEGGPDRASAAELTTGPADQPAKYVDKMSSNAPTYYRIPRQIEDSTVWFNVFAEGGRGYGFEKMEIELVTPDECANEYSGFFTNLTRVYSDGFFVDGSPPEEETEADCGDEELVVQIDPQKELGVPVEITVVEEPPVASISGLPPAQEPKKQRAAQGKPRPVTPATTTELAPTVDPGAYSFDLVGGEMRFLAVDLDWGQRIQLTLRRTSDEPFGALPVVIPPVGGQAAYDNDSFGFAVDFLNTVGGDVAKMTTTSVAYLNRLADEDYGAFYPMSLPGRYLVGVVADEDDSGAKMDVRTLALQIDVIGEVAGEPEYAVEQLDGSDGDEGDPPPSGDGSADVVLDETADEDDEAGLPLAPIAGGALAVAVLGVMAWWLLRRRPTE